MPPPVSGPSNAAGRTPAGPTRGQPANALRLVFVELCRAAQGLCRLSPWRYEFEASETKT